MTKDAQRTKMTKNIFVKINFVFNFLIKITIPLHNQDDILFFLPSKYKPWILEIVIFFV